MIKIERVTRENFDECIGLKVTKEQEDYVSSNTLSLAKAYAYYDCTAPFAVYNDDEMVGFILLRLSIERGWYIIWQFMIDERYQGKGYGKQAMRLAIDYMKQDERCKAIALAYKEGNEAARRLYESLGFKQMGEMEDGEVDMILELGK